MSKTAGVNALRPVQGRERRHKGLPALADQQHGMRALRWLCLTTSLEIALGLAVIYMVGVLGMTPPAGHHQG